MKTKLFPFLALALLSTLHPQLSTCFAQGTAFTYQGRLTDNGSPANGTYDFQFALFDAATNGTQQGGTLVTNDLAISNGLFTVSLDFGNQFPGANRWLEFAVRTNGGGSYSNLVPRQKITTVPYAITASNLSGTISAGQLSGTVPSSGLGGTYLNSVQFTHGSNQFTGTFTGNGSGLTGLNAWALSGNAGTTPATQYLGTSDNNPLTIKVNNATALRIEPATFGPNVIGGLAALRPTVVRPGVRGAVVAGGGAPAGPVTGLGGGDFFAVYDSDCAIGGGFGNKVGTDNGNVEDSPFATVAGGVFNSAANYASTVAGGDGNYAAGTRAAIGGGAGNQAFSTVSVIAGGEANVVQTNSPSATISGGQNNSISPGGFGYVSAKGATIGGGEGNTVFGLGGFPEVPLHNDYGTIGGGYSNTVNGSYGTVPGGYFNTASGDFSFAAGSRAAAGYGCFVWADASSTSPFFSTADNQFSIRAAGGVRLNTGTSMFFGSQTRQMLNLWSTVYGIGVQSFTTYFRTDTAGGFSWFSGGVHSDGQNNPGSGGTEMMRLASTGNLDVRGNVIANSVILTSDRNAKENFAPVDARAVLDKVAALPVSQWNFKTDSDTRHIGPMAQDFYAAFGVGPDDKHIATVDADGVALAAIQGLNQKLTEELKRRDAENAELKQRLEKLERLMNQKNGGAK